MSDAHYLQYTKRISFQEIPKYFEEFTFRSKNFAPKNPMKFQNILRNLYLATKISFREMPKYFT